MEKAKISASQLFILMVLFELGSALLVPLAIRAKQGAWLAICMACDSTGYVRKLYFIFSLS